jgi:biotin transport system permease protein
MLRYEPGSTLLHRLDPRSKLLAQGAFAVAALAHDSRIGLGLVTLLALAVLAVARLSPVRVLREFWYVLVVLALAPLFATVVVGPPWIVLERGIPSVLAGYQVVLVLFVSAAYVTTTPVRGTRAAIQRHVPGKAGQLLGVGAGLVFRLFPVMVEDLERIRDAIRARGGGSRPLTDRIARITRVGLARAFERADRLALALRARCFAWNPTLPELSFSRLDYVVVLVSIGLAVSPLVVPQ